MFRNYETATERVLDWKNLVLISQKAHTLRQSETRMRNVEGDILFEVARAYSVEIKDKTARSLYTREVATTIGETIYRDASEVRHDIKLPAWYTTTTQGPDNFPHGELPEQ